VDEPFDGVERDQVAGVGGSEVFRLTYDLSAFDGHDFPIMTHLLRVYPESPAVLDDPADGGDRGKPEGVLFAEWAQEYVELVLSQIRMQFPLTV
jgi:hypothetical protein